MSDETEEKRDPLAAASESTRRVLSFLDRMEARVHDMAPAQARQVFETLAPQLDRPSPALAERRSVDAGGVAAELSRPQELSSEPPPLIVFYHGGGFVIGSVAAYRGFAGNFATAAGALLLSVDYRLAPEHPFPAAPEDAFTAFRWAAANATALGADPERIFLAGDSAGGNLAAVTALMAREAGGPTAAGQILFYPATDMAHSSPSRRQFGQGFFLEEKTMSWFADAYLRSSEDAADWRASPLLAADHRDLPPAWLLTAGLDPLRDEGEAYGDRLEAAGVPVTRRRREGLIHGFLSMGAVVPEAEAALAEAAAWIRAQDLR